MRRLMHATPIILVILACAGPASALGFDLGLAAGAQLNGSIGELDLDTDAGFTLGLELMFEVPIVELGIGYEYGFPRDSDGPLSEIEHHLVYAAARIHFFGPAYAIGRFGYASLEAEIPNISGSDNGSSWSIGAGIEITKVKLEVLYNEMDITIDDLGLKVDYSSYTARLIYVF